MSQSESSKHSVMEALDGLGGGLLHLILGGLILWVGQTTFQHAGQLASVEKQFESVQQKFESFEKRYLDARNQLEDELHDLTGRTASRFTREDGDKLDSRIRQLGDRVTAVQLKVMTMDAQSCGSMELAALRAELTQLRLALQQEQSPGMLPNPMVAQGSATYRPAVNTRR